MGSEMCIRDRNGTFNAPCCNDFNDIALHAGPPKFFGSLLRNFSSFLFRFLFTLTSPSHCTRFSVSIVNPLVGARAKQKTMEVFCATFVIADKRHTRYQRFYVNLRRLWTLRVRTFRMQWFVGWRNSKTYLVGCCRVKTNCLACHVFRNLSSLLFPDV